MTGSISSIAGMTFDRVYVLGMTERAYPAPPPVDPIFPGMPARIPSAGPSGGWPASG